ncbi:hypothetical protein RUND412_004855 [Rhizina undulata]
MSVISRPHKSPEPYGGENGSWQNGHVRLEFSLYLVIGGLVPPNVHLTADDLIASSILEKLEAAIRGGVTAVQLRYTGLETIEYVRLTKEVLMLTRRHLVPLFIFDRIDVVLAARADGVELGDGCLDPATARNLLGSQYLIGFLVSDRRQIESACLAKPAYVTIGPLFKPRDEEVPLFPKEPTPKGPLGARELMRQVALKLLSSEHKFPILAGEGMDRFKIQHTLFQCRTKLKGLDGFVCGSLLLEEDPESSAKEFRELMICNPSFIPGAKNSPISVMDLGSGELKLPGNKIKNIHEAIGQIPYVINQIGRTRPKIICVTSDQADTLVSELAQTLGAQTTFSIDSTVDEDARNIGKCGFIDVAGTSAPANIQRRIFRMLNSVGAPVILDVTGISSSEQAKVSAANHLKSGYFSVLMGHAEDILVAAKVFGLGTGPTEKTYKGDSTERRAKLCKQFAERENFVVVVLGNGAVVSNGISAVLIGNGHSYLKNIPRWSIALSSVITACLAASPTEPFSATITGLLVFGIVSQLAAEREGTKATDKFFSALIQETWRVVQMTQLGDKAWVTRGEVEAIRNFA